ncbi:MAG: Multicopper oxidase, partial [Frankiales bacterium]|nr:Multicopper oxidase [Frankiales bacterium]
TIPTTALAALDSGLHVVYVRGHDSSGNWGVIGSAVLNVAKVGPQVTQVTADPNPTDGSEDVDVIATGDDRNSGGKVTNGELFFDAPGGDGTGIVLHLNRIASVVSMTTTLTAASVTALGEGPHTLYVHGKDSLGTWGGFTMEPFVVDLSGPTVDAASIGPNPTNGVVSDKSHRGYAVISAQITDMDHNGASSLLADAEAFIDPKVANPPGGSGIQLMSTDTDMDAAQEHVYGLVPNTHLKALKNGHHTLYVRGLDTAGNWGPLFAVDLVVDKTAPVIGTPVVSFAPTAAAATTAKLTSTLTELGTGVVQAEYWIGTTAPAVGKGTPVTAAVAAGGLSVSVTIDLTNVPAGSTRFNVRVKDNAGNWSKPVNATASFTKPNIIFADHFDGGGLVPPWSAFAGNVSNSATQQAFKLSFATTEPRVASYVTDTRPINEAGYHAKFLFNPTLLASNNANALTVFQARNAAGNEAFALQYRLNGVDRQVRVVMDRSIQADLLGNWYTLPTGASTVQVDWTSALNGTLRLSVNGALKQQLAGLNLTLRVDTVRLGVSAGQTSATRGTATYDDFISVRTATFPVTWLTSTN